MGVIVSVLSTGWVWTESWKLAILFDGSTLYFRYTAYVWPRFANTVVVRIPKSFVAASHLHKKWKFHMQLVHSKTVSTHILFSLNTQSHAECHNKKEVTLPNFKTDSLKFLELPLKLKSLSHLKGINMYWWSCCQWSYAIITTWSKVYSLHHIPSSWTPL